MNIVRIVTSLTLLMILTAPVAAYTFDTVIVSGRPAGDPAGPGLGAGIDWSSAARAVMNESGQVAVLGRLLLQGSVTSANDLGIWRWENGVLTMLAREGSQAPGLPNGVTVGSLSTSSTIPIQIDDAGTVVFRPNLAGTATAADNLAWTTVAADGTPTLVAREGNTAPGLVPVAYGDSLDIRSEAAGLAGSGKLLYRTNLAGPGVNSGNDSAFFYGLPNNPSLLIREGNAATEFGPAATYSAPSTSQASIAGDQVVLVVDITNGSTESALLAGAPGTMAVVAKSGQTVPGIGGSFQSFSAPRINSNGDVLFNSGNETAAGVFLRNSNGLQLVTAIGLPAPGTSETIFLSNDVNGFQTALATSGDAAFYANLAPGGAVDDANDSGLWVYDDGIARLAIREGDAFPGLPGINIGRIEHWTFNDREDLVFLSRLVGDVTAGVDDFALWHATANGTLRKILQTGELFDVDPAVGIDLRTISTIAIRGLPGGGVDHQSNEAALADDGRLLVSLNFTNGTSGVFVANLPVPEPASITTVVLTTLSFLAFIRRRTAEN